MNMSECSQVYLTLSHRECHKSWLKHAFVQFNQQIVEGSPAMADFLHKSWQIHANPHRNENKFAPRALQA